MKLALLLVALTCKHAFVVEALAHRNEPAFGEAKALPIGPPEDDVVVLSEQMEGPFDTAKAACSDCTEVMKSNAPWGEIATGGTHAAVRLHGKWWATPAVHDTDCTITYDGLVRDIITSAKGPELYLHSIERCASMGTTGEDVQICGVGDSGTPSCAEIPLDLADLVPGAWGHMRMDIRCDGTVIETYADSSGNLSHWKRRLELY